MSAVDLIHHASPNIRDALTMHYNADVLASFAEKNAPDGTNNDVLRSALNFRRFAFRQMVFGQCHTEADVRLKLLYLNTPDPESRDTFLRTLLNKDKGGDLAVAFLRSLMITGAGKGPPALPLAADQRIVRFLQDECVVTGRDADRVAAMQLYHAYATHGTEQGSPLLSDQGFFKGLQPLLTRDWADEVTGLHHRFWRQRSNQGYFYRGISLRAGYAGHDGTGSLPPV
ncbi:hypothetical protein ACCS33_10655 [Rhizobium ruizarguesonis]|nr:hypothetical protein [Rhizobium leguminosarum bv. viciae]